MRVRSSVRTSATGSGWSGAKWTALFVPFQPASCGASAARVEPLKG